LLTGGSLAAVSGNVYVGSTTQFMTLGNSFADVLTCGGGLPRLGERFYVRMSSSDVQGGGEAALYTRALRLPPGLYPAIDASNPVFCFAQNFTTSAVDPSVTCPNALIQDAFAGGGWGGGFSWSTGTTYSIGQSKVPAGWTFFGLIPVVATRSFAGLASASSDFLWGGVRVDYVGLPGTGYAYSSNPLNVSDRAPELSYPSSAAASITSSSALLTAQIANFWKVGTAVMEFGATTAYGRSTVADTIPGNDPNYAAYLTSPLPASGLLPGTTYHWRVRFTTAGGASYVGADQVFTTTGTPPVGVTAPGAPRTPKAVAGNRVAKVTWLAPLANGGSALTGYTVTASPGGRFCTSVAVTSCYVTGLTNGVAYRFSVRAANALGAGAASVATTAVVPSTVPSAVRVLKAAYPKVKVTVLTWVGPASSGGAAVLRYEVRVRKASVTAFGAWRSVRLVRAATIAGLLKRVSYVVQVRAVNVRGGSAVSQLTVRPTR
jgi:hypothetical protein